MRLFERKKPTVGKPAIWCLHPAKAEISQGICSARPMSVLSDGRKLFLVQSEAPIESEKSMWANDTLLFCYVVAHISQFHDYS